MDFSKMSKYNIKIKGKLEDIREYLVTCDYQQIDSFYMMDVYMIKTSMDKRKIQKWEDIEDYCIIEDINNIDKNIFLVQQNKIYKSNISSITTSKAMMEAFHYQELMFLNYHIYVYQSQEMKIYVKEILGQGIYFDIQENNKYNTEQKIVSYLRANKFPLEYSNLHVDNVQIQLEKTKKEWE